MNNVKTLSAWFRSLLACLVVTVVAFLALRASPYISEIPWIPAWLSEWADRHANLRNLPAFAGLAFALLWPLGVRVAACVASLLAVVLECAQVFIDGRTFDLADIGWSLLGVVLAVGLALAVRIRQHFRVRG